MPEISMKNMLEAGVHFGHQTHRWNPKMKPFIFAPRNGIYIIDLEKTVQYSKNACQFIKRVTSQGGKVLFVATKKQAKLATREAAKKAGMPFISERWLGGMLTNFSTIRQGCEKLDQLDMWRTDGTYEALPKKEVVKLERKRKKLEASLGGIRTMRALPQALFIIDPECEKIAVREANRLRIPVVALVDTNCDPDHVDYVIPGNDDAIKSVSLFVDMIASACAEGAQAYEDQMRQAASKKEAAQGAAAPKPEAPKAPSGPTVERVVHKALKNIPTDIDYRAEIEDEEEDEVQKAEGEQAEEVQAAADSAETATAEVPESKPEDK